jgi:hypothetical protein
MIDALLQSAFTLWRMPVSWAELLAFGLSLVGWRAWRRLLLADRAAATTV